MNRFTVNIAYTYDVPDEVLERDYDTTDLKAAAEIDEYNYSKYPYIWAEELSNGVDNLSLTVTAEKREL